MDLRPFLANLSHFPWRSTALTLRERFREDRLGLTASSLTFTTIMALVPASSSLATNKSLLNDPALVRLMAPKLAVAL